MHGCGGKNKQCRDEAQVLRGTSLFQLVGNEADELLLWHAQTRPLDTKLATLLCRTVDDAAKVS